MENLENKSLIERMKLQGFIVTDKKDGYSNREIIKKNGKSLGYMSPNKCWELVKIHEKLSKKFKQINKK